VSLYGDAIRALRQVILLDERVRNSAVDLARISQEVADLRDRAKGCWSRAWRFRARLHRHATNAGYRGRPIKPAEIPTVSVRRVPIHSVPSYPIRAY